MGVNCSEIDYGQGVGRSTRCVLSERDTDRRIYRATGEERLAEASRFWFARALAMRVPGRGVAGFRTYAMNAKRKLGWRGISAS
jgi:hypothetical protein